MTERIGYEDFVKLDIRIARIISAEKIEGTDRLMLLEIDAGAETRRLVAGIAHKYSPEELPGRLIPVLMNLQPRKIRGILSDGMILAADSGGEPVLLYSAEDLEPGSRVR
jgi:methionine--tRNA ligase beta chain